MMLISQARTIFRELEKLEVRYLANQDANLSFALFSDFLDAPDRDQPGDAALVEAAVQGIRQSRMAATYWRQLPPLSTGRANGPRLRRNAGSGAKRKRGKIEELNAYLTGHGSHGIFFAPDVYREAIRYVITLDSDTVLPPDSGRRMVETIAHPCNEAQIDPVARSRIRGYTIDVQLQGCHRIAWAPPRHASHGRSPIHPALILTAAQCRISNRTTLTRVVITARLFTM